MPPALPLTTSNCLSAAMRSSVNSSAACRVAAFQILAQLRQARIGQVGRSCVAGHRRVGAKKDADAANAVVEIRAEADELGKLGIAQPIETDPGDARAAAYGVIRQLRRDPVGFGDEGFFGRRDRGVLA